MNRIARIQTWAGLVAVVALPPLYLGATNAIPALTVAGFVVFAVGMLVTPALRYLPIADHDPEPAPESPAPGIAAEDGPADEPGAQTSDKTTQRVQE